VPVLPVPMVVALIFGYLAIRILVVKDRPPALALLIGAVAVQGVILSYAVLLPVQPVTAAMIPPLAWIVFQVTAVRAFDPGRDLWHLAVPAFTAFVLLVAPRLLDWVIPAIFAIYAAALLVRLKRGVDSLPRLSLGTGERPGLIWRLIAGALLLSALGDVVIAIALSAGEAWLKPWIVVALTAGNLGAIGLLSLSGALATGEADMPETEEAPPLAPEATAADIALMQRLEALMAEDGLYLDPNLTLARIARRLHVPAKQVSATVNRMTGENVSRYVNGHRIRHAATLLRRGENVTAAMLASGFNTKSNFNREFLRVTGAAPSTLRERPTETEAPRLRLAASSSSMAGGEPRAGPPSPGAGSSQR
jgi:AraC-like DNA-binding protein